MDFRRFFMRDIGNHEPNWTFDPAPTAPPGAKRNPAAEGAPSPNRKPGFLPWIEWVRELFRRK
jgi:hypothetical protein